MAFGGSQTNASPSGAPNLFSWLSINGLTLAARIGAPSAAAADTGVLTTAAPGANQNPIPAGFGPGQGNWTADLVNQVLVVIADPGDTSAGNAPSVHRVSKSLVGNDLVVTLHNRGALASGALEIDLSLR